MSIPAPSAQARINENTFRVASRLLAALMLACGVQTIVSLIGQVAEGWYPWYLSVTSFLVALACFYTFPYLKKILPFSQEWFGRIVALWVLILAILRLVVGLVNGPAAFLDELTRWPQDISLVLSGEFFLAALLAVSTWFLADMFADLLTKLDLEYVRMQQELPDPIESSLQPARQRLLSLILGIGIGLVFLTALMRVDLRAALGSEFVIQQLPRLAGGGASTLLYFVFGLALFSLSQFMDLQGRWYMNNVTVGGNLAGRWAQYSLLFLGLLAVLVSLLPTHYSLGLLYILGYGLGMIVQVVFYLLQFALFLFVALVNSVFSFSGQDPPLEEPPTPEPEMPEFFMNENLDTAASSAAPEWVAFMRQAFFWVMLAGVLIFAFRQVLYYNSELFDELRRFRLFALLADLWARFAGFFRQATASLGETVQKSIERLRAGRKLGQNVGDWINLRRLDPRHRIYFFYQAFLRRSGENGLPRSLSQTPAEFAQRLDQALPEAEPDIEALTSAFIEARYTRREIDPEDASLAQRTWQRLRKVFRPRKEKSRD